MNKFFVKIYRYSLVEVSFEETGCKITIDRELYEVLPEGKKYSITQALWDYQKKEFVFPFLEEPLNVIARAAFLRRSRVFNLPGGIVPEMLREKIVHIDSNFKTLNFRMDGKPYKLERC